MLQYSTRYNHGGGCYCCDIFASSEKEARKIAKKRGLKEIVEYPSKFNLDIIMGDKVPSYMIKNGYPIMKILHAISHLADLAIRSKTCNPSYILGDTGLLHDYIHYQQFEDSFDKEEFMEKLETLENTVPGYLPPKELR